VTVRNDTEEALSFGLTGTASQDRWRQGHVTTSQQAFTAAKAQTSYHTLMVPMCNVHLDASSGYGSANYSLNLRLTGAANGFHRVDGMQDPGAMAAFTKALTTDQIGKFNQDPTTASSSGRPREFAVQFEHTYLPADWRALSGFDYVSFSTNEWLQLTAAVRASVLQWVELGGTLSLYTQAKETMEQLQIRPAATQAKPGDEKVRSSNRYGFGQVRVIPWDGAILRPDHLRSTYPHETASNAMPPKTNLTDADRKGFWSEIQKQFGERSFNAWQIGIILILFGLLVGPINLFYFAKAGQRHRLFFTTPIISLGASLLLILFILFQDGTGGNGVRTSLVYVNPTAATVSIQQSQLSRTGVMFSSNFATDEPANVSPVTLPDTRWTRLKSRGDGSGQNFTMSDAKSYSGDWFQSRSEQAQLLEMVRSSRGRIELANATDQPPVLRSSFAYPLAQIFYVDGTGKLWRSTGELTTGGSANLTSATIEDLQALLNSYGINDHPFITRATAGPLPPNHFFGFTRDPKAEFITTLASIDWSQHLSFVWGPLPTSANAATPSPAAP
jgi:hypothetical protein